MAVVSQKKPRVYDYPTSDGKPMAETDYHRILMTALIQTLDFWYADQPRVYVSGNLLMYYVPGNKRKHISPDVFVVKGVKKQKRLYYLTWKERKSPSVVFEITSASTRKEDVQTKHLLYRDVLKVPEYFLFDPFGDYLKPQLKGYRLHKGDYLPMEWVDGRLLSEILGLHLEPDGHNLRLYDPVTKQYVLTPEERAEQEKERAELEKERAEQEKERAEQEKERAELEKKRAERERQRAEKAEQDKAALEAELERMRRKIESSRRNGA